MKFLDLKSLNLWERIKQEKAIELAQIDGLEVSHIDVPVVVVVTGRI